MKLEGQQKEVLISLQEYISRFIPGLKQVIEWFQQGDEQKALENMVYVIEGLEWITEALSLTKELQDSSIEIEKINPLLLQINEGLEQSDSILIADILEYEIIPIVEDWHLKITVQ